MTAHRAPTAGRRRAGTPAGTPVATLVGTQVSAAALLICCVAAPATEAETIFALVDTGEIFASTDTGVTWERRSALAVRDAVGLLATETTEELVMVTRSGGVYFSNDAGFEWMPVGAVPASDIEAVTMRQDGALLVLTATGAVWASTDVGGSFTAIAALTGVNHVSLAQARSTALYALAATGEVVESVDGGVHWLLRGAINVPDAVEIMEFNGDLIALAATGIVARSFDEGATWSAIGTLSQVHMSGLTVDRARNLMLATTQEGDIAASPDGVHWAWSGVVNQVSVTTIANDTPLASGVREELAPSAVALGHPWPNPVSARAVTIPIQLQREGKVTLVLYDGLGRAVGRLGPQSHPAGRHAVTWQLPVGAAGIYFVELRAAWGASARQRVVMVR